MTPFLRHGHPINPTIIRKGPAPGKRLPRVPEMEYWESYQRCGGCETPTPEVEMKLTVVGRTIERRCGRCRGRAK